MTWLIAALVLAGMFFLLWLVAHSRLQKPTLTLIEPLHLVTKSWQIARYTGQGSQVEVAMKVLASTKNGESEVEKILPAIKGKLLKAALLDSRTLPLIGEQKLVEENNKRFSYIIGVNSEVSSRLILTSTEKKELEKLEEKAGSHGFLALLVGRSSIHGSGEKLESLQHVYLGAVLLEPVLDAKVLAKISALPEPKKFLTVLPATLAASLAQKAGLAGPVFTANSTVSAEKFDQKVQSATVIASADSDTRYRATRALEHTHRCHFYDKK